MANATFFYKFDHTVNEQQYNSKQQHSIENIVYRRDTAWKRCRSQLLWERKYYDIILKSTYLKM